MDENIVDFMSEELGYLFPLNWDQVFNTWRVNEAGQERWQEHYKGRGFGSWEEWRMSYAKPFRCPEASWHQFRIRDPLATIPNFFGGPFRGWVEKHYAGEEGRTFGWLVNQQVIQNHTGILRLANHFLFGTIITGLVIEDRVYIVEGMHRCCSLAMRALCGSQDIESEVQICLARFPGGGNLPVVGQTQAE